MSVPMSSLPPEYLAAASQPPKKSNFVRWLIGLALVGFGMVLVAGILCVAGVCYVASNLDRWVVGLGREAIVAAINESELPQQEKGEVIVQIDRVVEAYKERRINQNDLQRIFTDLQDSPAMIALSLSTLPGDYLTDTNLSEQELAQGRQTFQRIVRGVYERKISEEALYAVLPDELGDDAADDHTQPPVADRVRLASTHPAQHAADDDLREALAKLKVMADNAGIPDAPFEIDISDEVQKLVDKALAGK